MTITSTYKQVEVNHMVAKRLMVLLAEDDPLKAKLLIRMISKAGLEVQWHAAANVARHALREFAENDMEMGGQCLVAVITDWNMPFLLDGDVKAGAGESMLRTAEQLNVSIPLYVCSSEDKPHGVETQAPWFVFGRDDAALGRTLSRLA